MKKPTPWQRIVKAYKEGRGVHLSFEEVERLNMDDAITTRAMNDDRGENEDDPNPFRENKDVDGSFYK